MTRDDRGLPGSKPSGFVVVQNRNRDDYEVALALEQAGLLARLITDFYRPDRLPDWLAGPLSHRRREGLPADKVGSSWSSFAIQYAGQLLGIPMERVFARSDRALARVAARIARRLGAGLYAYSSYLGETATSPDDRPVIDFEYHPHPKLSLEILAADFARFPQVGWSHRRECALAATAPLTTAWRQADAVVCASGMTRRALLHAGCPAERIAVIPYGAPEAVAPPAARLPGTCRFLFVGQGVQRKGLHHLAQAWRRAGLAQAELAVASYVLDPGIAAMLDQPGITVVGRQNRAALNALFARADVFVMPSLVEGFGLVYLEALAAGCHVVGTQNTGLPDLPLTPRAATVLPPGDIAALAQALASIAARKHEGSLDPTAIQAETRGWTMADFRLGIAGHARGVLDRG